MHEFGKKQRKKLFILIFVDTIQQFQLITMINDVCFMQKSMILIFIYNQPTAFISGCSTLLDWHY